MPDVSVIIPTHNRLRLLQETLRSVYAQTWEDLEVVVVDDASSDGTSRWIREHEREAPRTLKVITHSMPRGPSIARNAGVEASNGDWIIFLDDDDLLHPCHIRSLRQALSHVPDGNAIAGRWRHFFQVDERLVFGPVMTCPLLCEPNQLLRELLDPVGEGSIHLSSVLWPRMLLERVHWDEELFDNGDFDFMGRSLLYGCRIYGVDDGMFFYRKHSGARVSVSSIKALRSSTRYRLKWSKLLLERGDCERYAVAMCNGLMSLLISWAHIGAGREYLPKLEAEFQAWGGARYYLPSPPRNLVKRAAATAVLKIGGVSTFGTLMRWYSGHYDSNRSTLNEEGMSEDNEHAEVINAFQ